MKSFSEFLKENLNEEKKDFAHSFFEILEDVVKRCKKDFKNKNFFISHSYTYDFFKDEPLGPKTIYHKEEIYTKKAIDELNILFVDIYKKSLKPIKKKVPWTEGIYFFQMYLTDDTKTLKQGSIHLAPEIIVCNFFISPENFEIVILSSHGNGGVYLPLGAGQQQFYYKYDLPIDTKLKGVITGIKTGIV